MRHSHVGLGGRHRNDSERGFSIVQMLAFQFRTPSMCVLQFMPCIVPFIPQTPGVYNKDCYFFCDARDVGRVED